MNLRNIALIERIPHTAKQKSTQGIWLKELCLFDNYCSVVTFPFHWRSYMQCIIKMGRPGMYLLETQNSNFLYNVVSVFLIAKRHWHIE